MTDRRDDEIREHVVPESLKQRRAFADALFGPPPDGPPPEVPPPSLERIEAISRAWLNARPDIEPHPEHGIQTVINFSALMLTRRQADELGIREAIENGEYPGVAVMSVDPPTKDQNDE